MGRGDAFLLLNFAVPAENEMVPPERPLVPSI